MLQVTLPYTIPVVFWSAFDLAWGQKFILPISAPISTTATDVVTSSH